MNAKEEKLFNSTASNSSNNFNNSNIMNQNSCNPMTSQNKDFKPDGSHHFYSSMNMNSVPPYMFKHQNSMNNYPNHFGPPNLQSNLLPHSMPTNTDSNNTFWPMEQIKTYQMEPQKPFPYIQSHQMVFNYQVERNPAEFLPAPFPCVNQNNFIRNPQGGVFSNNGVLLNGPPNILYPNMSGCQMPFVTPTVTNGYTTNTTLNVQNGNCSNSCSSFNSTYHTDTQLNKEEGYSTKKMCTRKSRSRSRGKDRRSRSVSKEKYHSRSPNIRKSNERNTSYAATRRKRSRSRSRSRGNHKRNGAHWMRKNRRSRSASIDKASSRSSRNYTRRRERSRSRSPRKKSPSRDYSRSKSRSPCDSYSRRQSSRSRSRSIKSYHYKSSKYSRTRSSDLHSSCEKTANMESWSKRRESDLDRQKLIEKWRMNNCDNQDEMQRRLQEISQMNPDELLQEENKVWIRSAPADCYYERDQS